MTYDRDHQNELPWDLSPFLLLKGTRFRIPGAVVIVVRPYEVAEDETVDSGSCKLHKAKEEEHVLNDSLGN